MKQKLYTFIFRVCLALLFVSVISCSDSETENSDTSNIIGVWEEVGPNGKSYGYYLNLKSGNAFDGIEIATSGYSKDHGNYYYDQNTGLIMLFWAPGDCDVYEVVKLSDKELVYCWIDDVSDRYTSNQFNVSAALEVIREVYKEGYSIDYGDYEYYIRSSESKLNSALSGLTMY